MTMAFYNRKRSTIKAAKELHYDKNVIEKLNYATTDSELSHIMCTARKRLTTWLNTKHTKNL